MYGEARQPALDLSAQLDDATSVIYSAFLVDEEGAASTFRALYEVFGRHGLRLEHVPKKLLDIFDKIMRRNKEIETMRDSS